MQSIPRHLLIQPKLFKKPDFGPKEDAAENAVPQLFRHTRRPEWGLAICLWQRDRRRAFQFEDGELRIFVEGHDGLLERVSKPTSQTVDVADRLRAMSGVTLARREREKSGDMPELSFEQQLLLFSHQFPGGFEDPEWLKDVRGGGEDVPRRLKRHRAPAIQQAGDMLPVELLGTFAACKGGDVAERLHTILKATDMCTKKHLAPLTRDLVEPHRMAEALHNLLAGQDHVEQRMQHWIDTIARCTGQAPSWHLATAPAALAAPNDHVWVRTSAFREQIKELAPDVTLANIPDGRHYVRMLRVAKLVAKKLVDAEHRPRDLVDVVDFIWSTLKPAARKQLTEIEPTETDSDESGADAA